VTGLSALPGSATFHPFLWTRDKGIQDLGVKGDLVGAGLAMSSRGDIVGASISAPVQRAEIRGRSSGKTAP